MTECFVGLGSNVEPARHLRIALLELERRFGALRCSRVYRNRAVGFDGDDFLNMVVAFQSSQPPRELSGELRRIERAAGRRRGERRFGPRSLDIDLLMCGALVVDEPGLKLPRPEVLGRAFVLGPLAELAPQQRHPVSGRTLAEHWAAFDRSDHPLEPVKLG